MPRRPATLTPHVVLAVWLALSLLVAGRMVLSESAAACKSQDIAADDDRPRLDPAAWGSDHVGRPLPDYIESGECLFCHRQEVGSTWGRNRHERTIRDALPAEPAVEALQREPSLKPLADEVQLLLGDRRQNCFLRRSTEYGKVDMLSVRASAGRGRRMQLVDLDDPQWDSETFAARCAGCHATGVHADGRFSALSLDCYVCHGDTQLDHTNDASLVLLAKEREDSAAVVTSICAQCHVRFGKSKSTGRPYPNNFVGGDNLFRDFEVDWSKADDPDVNPADRHVLDNVREVVLHGNETMTCLSCHDVHQQSSRRHRDLPDTKYCAHCHNPAEPKSNYRRYEVHSPLCGY